MTDLVGRPGQQGAVVAGEHQDRRDHPPPIAACTGLARSWRLRRDVRESYIAASQKVEQDFSLSKLDFDAERIVAIETFLAVERALLRHVEESLLIAGDG